LHRKTKIFDMTEEIRNKARMRFEELKLKARINDPVVHFLKKLVYLEFDFSSRIRMLPFGLVEQYGVKILQDEREFERLIKSTYDVFRTEWDYHHKEFWKDIVQLLEVYQKENSTILSPFEIFNNESDLMIKIERRSLLLNPEPKSPKNIVEQKQKRLDGSEKDYRFIRAYWIDSDGSKKRMIARHIGYRYTQVEKEIADLFHNRGFAVHRNYRPDLNHSYDMVIEREGMKTVVEVKMIDENIFNDLFLFDELQKRFNQDYKIE